MSLFSQFPYTNFHDLNLDWILSEIQGIMNRLESLEKRMDAAEEKIEFLLKEVAEIRDDIARLRAEWDAYKAEMDAKWNAFKAEIEARFAALEAEFDAKFTALQTALEARITALEHDIDDRFVALTAELRKEIQDTMQYLIDKCAEFTERVVRLEVRVENMEAAMDACCHMITDKLTELLDAIGQGGGQMNLITKTITSNGTYRAADDNADGFSSVTVAVPLDSFDAEQLEVQSWANVVGGTTEPDRVYRASDSNADGYDVVTLKPLSNEVKEIAANGTYTDESKTSRWGQVVVNVPVPTLSPLTVYRNGEVTGNFNRVNADIDPYTVNPGWFNQDAPYVALNYANGEIKFNQPHRIVNTSNNNYLTNNSKVSIKGYFCIPVVSEGLTIGADDYFYLVTSLNPENPDKVKGSDFKLLFYGSSYTVIGTLQFGDSPIAPPSPGLIQVPRFYYEKDVSGGIFKAVFGIELQMPNVQINQLFATDGMLRSVTGIGIYSDSTFYLMQEKRSGSTVTERVIAPITTGNYALDNPFISGIGANFIS